MVLGLNRAAVPPLAPDPEAQVGDPCALDDQRVVQEHGGVGELAEEADAAAQEDRRQVDGELVDQAEVERLRCGGARDPDLTANPVAESAMSSRTRAWPDPATLLAAAK